MLQTMHLEGNRNLVVSIIGSIATINFMEHSLIFSRCFKESENDDFFFWMAQMNRVSVIVDADERMMNDNHRYVDHVCAFRPYLDCVKNKMNSSFLYLEIFGFSPAHVDSARLHWK